jgi:integrase
MCSLFCSANSEFHIESPMKNVPAPQFQKVEIEPFTREEVSRMLKACTYSREVDTSYRRQFVMRRPTANRDQAVILTLLDSCVRPSEFCAFRIGDFDPKRGKLEIRHRAEGGAKGGVGRIIYLPSLRSLNGRDVVVVKGDWIYDSLRDGWNEIHAVHDCLIIGPLEPEQSWADFQFTDLSTGMVLSFDMDGARIE